jgi:hypothetical protein
MVSQDAHLAAYLGEGVPRMVEAPLAVPMGVVRSVVLHERRWGALFSEHGADASWLDDLRHLWYAEYDGERWSPVESLPLPPNEDLNVSASSALVLDEGVLRWALVATGGNAFVYERQDGAWRFEMVGEGRLETAALAAGPSGLWLALSGFDPGVSGPRKSVRLFHREVGWRLVSRNPTAEQYTELPGLSVAVLPGGVALTWIEATPGGELVALARHRITADDPGTLLVLDRGAERANPLSMPDGVPAWTVLHANTLTSTQELRFVRAEGDKASVLRVIPYPYTGWYAAMATGPNEVLVTGSEFNPDPAQPTVRSLTLRLNPFCR